MEIRGTAFTDKGEAGKAIAAACQDCRIGETMPLGSYRGFHLELTFDGLSKEFQLSLRGSMTHRIALGASAQGNMIRIDNAIAALPEKLEKARRQLEELYAQQESTKAEVGKPFPQEAELTAKSARLAELDALLNMDVSGGPEFLPGDGDGMAEDGDEAPDSPGRSSVLADLRSRSETVPPPAGPGKGVAM